MSTGVAITLLSALVLLFAVLRAAQALRQEKGRDQRGSAPGKGYHEVDASYHSGGAGGGQDGRFRVPRDPQEYARMFIPKDRRD